MDAVAPSARKWALLVQGPLFSPLPDASWLKALVELRAAEGGAVERVEPDCSSAVEATVERAAPYVEMVVVATWNSPANADRARSLAAKLGFDLLLLDDPGPSAWLPGGRTDNRYRQLYSTLRGLERIALRAGATNVVRTRSDQVVDVGAIVRHVDGSPPELRTRCRVAGQLDYVYVPGVFVASPYAIDDFYFAGALPDLLRFFQAQWTLRDRYFGSTSIHTDLVLKHLYANLRARLGARWFECFPVVTNPRDLDRAVVVGKLGRRYLELWTAILRTAIKPLPRSIYEALVFRGVAYGQRYPRLFAEDWERLGDDIASAYTEQAPRVFSSRAYGVLGAALNYAPEAALAHRAGLVGRAGRSLDRLRVSVTDLRRTPTWEPSLAFDVTREPAARSRPRA